MSAYIDMHVFPIRCTSENNWQWQQNDFVLDKTKIEDFESYCIGLLIRLIFDYLRGSSHKIITYFWCLKQCFSWLFNHVRTVVIIKYSTKNFSQVRPNSAVETNKNIVSIGASRNNHLFVVICSRITFTALSNKNLLILSEEAPSVPQSCREPFYLSRRCQDQRVWGWHALAPSGVLNPASVLLIL